MLHKLKYIFKTILSAICHPHNFIFCLRYPFWAFRDCEYNINYRTTYYEDLPLGWKKAFGKQLSKELKKALIKEHSLYKFNFIQIKEKWGGLRLYADCSDNIQTILDKYEDLSYKYCIVCGKSSEYCTRGWVEVLCEDCYNKYMRYDPEDPEKVIQKQREKM